MWGLLAVHICVILLLLILGWAVRKKEGYWLISGFSSRPKEEQEELVRSGYPQKIGSLLIITALGMVIFLPLVFTTFKYAMKVQFGFMMIFLMGGMIYLTKYEVPKKRKRSYLISISLFIVIIGGIGALSYFSYQGYQLVTKEETFKITGMYGDEWKYKDITSIVLMEKLPEVTERTNGVGLPTLSKGHFKVAGYGSSLLFVQKGSSPYIYIELKDKKIFINDKNPEQTKIWFEQVSRKQNKLNNKSHLLSKGGGISVILQYSLKLRSFFEGGERMGVCWNEKVRFSNTNNKLMNEMGYVYEESKKTK